MSKANAELYRNLIQYLTRLRLGMPDAAPNPPPETIRLLRFVGRGLAINSHLMHHSMHGDEVRHELNQEVTKEERREEMVKNGNKPVFERRLGNIRFVIFQNDSNGRAYFNVSMTRSYKDSNEWRDTNTFNGLHDLALVTELIRQGTQYLAEHESAEKAAE